MTSRSAQRFKAKKKPPRELTRSGLRKARDGRGYYPGKTRRTKIEKPMNKTVSARQTSQGSFP